MARKDGFYLKNENKKAILLLHGLTGSPFELRWIGKRFHNENYDVFCPVLPGHCSTLEDLKNSTWKDWYNGAKSVLENIISSGYEKIYTAGLCVGGVIALLLALEYKEKVTSVAAWSPILFLDGWTIPKSAFLLPLILATPMKHFFSFKEAYPYGIKNDATRKRIISMGSKDVQPQGEMVPIPVLEGVAYNNHGLEMVSSMFTTPFASYFKEFDLNRSGNDGLSASSTSVGTHDRIPGVTLKELLKCFKFTKKHIGKLDKPALLIHSRYDDVTSVKSSQFLFDNIASKTKELVILENSYHMVTIDNDKETVFKETFEFFEKN